MRIGLRRFLKEHFLWEVWRYSANYSWRDNGKGEIVERITLRDIVEDPYIQLLQEGKDWVRIRYNGKTYFILWNEDVRIRYKFNERTGVYEAEELL